MREELRENVGALWLSEGVRWRAATNLPPDRCFQRALLLPSLLILGV
jgi:hypothetical protein